MNTVWEILYSRQMALHYAAPGICEVIFSGSSNPVIVLSEPALNRVTGLVLGGAGNFTLSWNDYPGAICYNIYFIGGDNVAVPLAQCIEGTTFVLPDDLDPGIIVVTAITLEGETPPSDPVPYPSAASFFLTIDSDPVTGIPFSLGPADLTGASSGVTTAIREYAPGRQVFITAEQTFNYLGFLKWELNGSDYSTDLSTSVLMNSDLDLTAVYSCGNPEGAEVPSDFTLTGPTSLGIFQVPPSTDAVVVGSSAPASSYTVIYRGGSIRNIDPGGCGPSEEVPDACFLPPGMLVKYNGGVDSINLSNSAAIEDHCVVSQELLESLFPLDESEAFAHTGGSLLFQWNATVTLDGTSFPIEDFECGDSCPQWEIIQDTGLITQPGSWQIRDYDAWIAEVLPMARYDMGDAGCTDFTSANFPLETGVNQVPWAGGSAESSLHIHDYFFNFFVDGLDAFTTPVNFFPIAIAGFEGSFSQVVAPKTEAEITGDIMAGGGTLSDPFPTVASDRYWYFALWGSQFTAGPIWAGVKTSGETFVGTYQRIACACPVSAPSCMYLESGD